MGGEDERAELGRVAASLRAYLEWQVDTGAHGIPRARRGAQAPATTTTTTPTTTTATATATTAPTTAALPTQARAAPSLQPASAPFEHAPEIELAQSPTAPAVVAPPALVVPADPAARLVRLTALAAEAAPCMKCALGATRTNSVFARGNPQAKLCFVGEAPGADEDAQGLPFVGRAGQLLDKMIAAMGLDPAKDVYVCNILKCRPPDNRRPTPEETATCIPYLHEQLALVEPKVIVALGNTAVAALLNTKLGITKLRGQWKLYKGSTLVMPTYHPSYLIRPSAQQIEAKRQAWEDLQAVMKELGIELPPRNK